MDIVRPVSRRSVTRTAVWAVPAVTVAAAAPAFAASTADLFDVEYEVSGSWFEPFPSFLNGHSADLTSVTLSLVISGIPSGVTGLDRPEGGEEDNGQEVVFVPVPLSSDGTSATFAWAADDVLGAAGTAVPTGLTTHRFRFTMAAGFATSYPNGVDLPWVLTLSGMREGQPVTETYTGVFTVTAPSVGIDDDIFG